MGTSQVEDRVGNVSALTNVSHETADVSGEVSLLKALLNIVSDELLTPGFKCLSDLNSLRRVNQGTVHLAMAGYGRMRLAACLSRGVIIGNTKEATVPA